MQAEQEVFLWKVIEYSSVEMWWTFKSEQKWFPYQGEIDFDHLHHHDHHRKKPASKLFWKRTKLFTETKNTELVNLQFQVAYLSNSIMHNHLSLLLIWPCGIPFSKVVMYVTSIKFWWCPFYLFFNSLFRTRGILSFGMKKRKRWI